MGQVLKWIWIWIGSHYYTKEIIIIKNDERIKVIKQMYRLMIQIQNEMCLKEETNRNEMDLNELMNWSYYENISESCSLLV